MSALLVFLSGFAALVYQVLWMRDLAVLFGSSAAAAAIVLAVFFGGMAAGAALFARMVPRVTTPLRVYGLLELAIAASALLFLLMLPAYGVIYGPLYRQVADRPLLLVILKSLLAAGLLGIPTVLMGATLPAMVMHAGKSALLYGTNTAGAAAGAFIAGFYLPPLLGFRRSYVLAVVINVAVGCVALAMRSPSRLVEKPIVAGRRPARRPGPAPADSIGARFSSVLAFASGLLTIGLEMTWLRMFGQVLDNSVYGFSAVVVTALVVFAAASLLVSRLQPEGAAARWLVIVLAASAIGAAAQGPLFTAMTNDMAPISADAWGAYLRRTFTMAAAVGVIGGFAAGFVFPLLLRASPPSAAGGAVARLLAWNTAGAVIGSIAITFVVFRWLGVWTTSAVIGALYAGLGMWLAARHGRRTHQRIALAALVTTLAAGAFSTTLTRVRLDAERSERVVELWEGSYGTVAVTENANGRLLRLNNTYSLGGTTDRIERERIQTLIPLLLHRDPKHVFFLGLGTGITAGEALRHPVERVVICELIPEVVHASRRHFNTWTRGLASDARADIRVEDGRHFLASSAEAFDVIVSDLFVPWHAGTGMLYTREHFEIVRARLRPGGVFAQWLPLFQLSRRDFDVIARTLLAVFPHAVLWRGDFYANRPIVAVIASSEAMAVDPVGLQSRARALVPHLGQTDLLARLLPFYAGNLAAARALVAGGPLNTDERPLIEYLSPHTQWEEDADWFASTRLVRFFERLRAEVPTDRDPYLSRLAPEQLRYVDAGHFYYKAIVSRLRGEDDAASIDLAAALERLPPDVQVSGPFMALDPLVRPDGSAVRGSEVR